MNKSILFYYSPQFIEGSGQVEILTEYGPVWVRAECVPVYYGDALDHATPHEDEAVMNGHPAPGDPSWDEDLRPDKRYLFLRTWTRDVRDIHEPVQSEYVFVLAKDEDHALEVGGRDPQIREATSGERGSLFVTDYIVEIPE